MSQNRSLARELSAFPSPVSSGDGAELDLLSSGQENRFDCCCCRLTSEKHEQYYLIVYTMMEAMTRREGGTTPDRLRVYCDKRREGTRR